MIKFQFIALSFRCVVGTGVLDGPLPQCVFVVPVAVPGTLVGANAFLVCRPLPLAQVASSATGGAPIAPRPGGRSLQGLYDKYEFEKILASY